MRDALSYGAGRLILLVVWFLAQLTVWLIARHRTEASLFHSFLLCAITGLGLSLSLLGGDGLGLGRLVLAGVAGVFSAAVGLKLVYEDLLRWQFWFLSFSTPIYFVAGLLLTDWIARG